MSIHVSQFDTEAVRHNTRSGKPARSRTEAKFEVRGSHNRVRTTAGIIDVEPKEARSTTQIITHGKSIDKSLKISKARSHVASAWTGESSRSADVTIGHVSTAIHYIGSPKPTKSTNRNVVSSTSQPKSVRTYYRSSVMAGSRGERGIKLASAADIPGIPEQKSNEQPTHRVERTIYNTFPASATPRYQHNFTHSGAPASSAHSTVTDFGGGSNAVSSKQATSKQLGGLRVKGQSGSNQWNANAAESYPSKADRCDPYSKLRTRNDYQASEFHQPVADKPEMDGITSHSARTRTQQSENTNTDVGEQASGFYNYEKQNELYTRQTTKPNYKHYSSSSRATPSMSGSFTESGSDGFNSPSESDASVSSADLSRSHSSSSKRRKRVKRKVSGKSIGSSIYRDDNTSEGESANDTLRRHERRSRTKRDEESSGQTSTTTSQQLSKGQSNVLGSSMPSVKAGSQFRSSSLTSVSSAEGSRGASRTQSPLLTQRGSTVAKKIQIQSFSAAYTNFSKDNKENKPRRRASAEERTRDRFGERLFFNKSDNSGSMASLDREPIASPPVVGPQPSKGRPFTLRNKRFHLKRSSSKETSSPCTSDADSATPTLRHRDDIASSDKEISTFTDKPNSLASITPTPLVAPVTTISSSTETSDIYSPYSIPALDDEVFTTSAFTPITSSDTRVHSYTPDDDEPSLMETGPVTIGEPTAEMPISGLACDRGDGEPDAWISQSYPPLRTYPSESSTLPSPYFNRPLSIVNEQEEADTLAQSSSENFENSKRNGFSKRISNKHVESNLTNTMDDRDHSAVRRPSYVRAQQQNLSDFVLFHSMSDSDPETNVSHKTRNGSKHSSKKNRKNKDNSSSSEQQEALGSLLVNQVDLITFDEPSGRGSSPAKQGIEYPGEPVVKKRKKKIARPKIPTIFDLEEGKEFHDDDEDDDDDDDDRQLVPKAREETLGQDSTDEKSADVGGSVEEDLDMIEGSSKRNTLVAIESDEESTPKATHSPASELEDDRMKPSLLSEDMTKSRSTKLTPYPSPPEITTDLYIDDSAEDDSLRKVDTIYDLSEDENPGISYIDQEEESDIYQDTKSLESYGTQSDTMDSPDATHMLHDQYSLTTSGFSEAVGDLSDSGEIPIDEALLIGSGKSSDNGWRSQSDPSGRTNGAGAPLCDTIAEAAELIDSNYRNSNSAPNLITEKVKKESAQLAKRVSKNQMDARPSVTRTKSTPPALLKPIERPELMRRKSEGSKEEFFHIEGSPDDSFEMDTSEDYQKNIRIVKSAPTTPTSPRKQLYQNQFSAEKAQMKLAKLAAMEPIYETPPTETVKPIPLPEPVKLERQSGLIPVTEETKRPPATGTPATTKIATKTKSKHDIKRHVLQNLLDTEISYVQNLQYVVTSYLKPLKKPENANIVDPAQVDEMFYQIPDILLCHEFFLDQLQARVNDWHDKQKIGDIIVASFTKCFLMDAYSAFINHFLHARAAVRVATMSRPGFARFIEQACREHKEKLTLQDLMIMPVQRIPRYVLILKDMIKHTAQDHPDHGSLQLAMGEIKTLANRMNQREKEVNKAEKNAEELRAIEASIEGISDLVVPGRYFKRKDLAAEVRGSITKKDRNLFLFNDLMVCAIVKRKPNALRRGSLSLFSGQSGGGAEFNKHKLLWKIPLEYIELIRSSPETPRRNSLEKELERLDNDMSLLSQISALSDTLNISHQVLDSSIRELMNDVSRQIADRQVPIQQSLSAKLELQAQTEEGLETFTFLLLDAEIKNSWEADFENAKKELAHAKDTFPPEFQQPIPITKTRSGMQFTCSSPSLVPHMLDRGNHCGSGDVWVCNSDGYVGQVCILSMGEHIEPLVSLSVCSSRILCISPVPGANLVGLETLHPDPDSKSDTRSLGETSSYKGQKTSSEYNSDEEVRSAQTIMAFDSSSEDEDALGNDSFMGDKFGSGSPMFDGRLSPEGSSLGTIDGEMESSDDDDNQDSEFDDNASSDDDDKPKSGRKHGGKRRNSTPGTAGVSGAEDKLSDIVAYDTEESSTVWLGTEDGSIFVYPVKDVQQKSKKMKIQHTSSVQCILYVDNQVFISLGNGDLCVYRRQPGCAWEVASPIVLHVGGGAPVACMTAVHGRLWCGCQCNAIIVNTTTLKIERTFNCSSDKDRAVYRMVSSGMGVWLSLQSSATVRLFHATRYECLADVDVAPPVHKMLAGSDAIIRQHKAACLRVTSLLTCKDLLWIGTSAGVVLTLPLPTISITTSSLRNSPNATASYHGHTGHVRFLTAVEVPKDGDQDTALEKERNNSVSSPSNTEPPLTPGGPGGANGTCRDILIISGGDGYEDFKTSSTSESAGRDDSTNHLLIWQV